MFDIYASTFLENNPSDGFSYIESKCTCSIIQ